MDNNVKPNSMPRLVWLDSLRLVMAVIIVISHFEFLSNASYGSFYDTYIHNPTLALDYFFLLTGLTSTVPYVGVVSQNELYV